MTLPDVAASPAPVYVSNLSKRFVSLTAIQGVSFAVAAGEVLGLVGPNGAGKTTTIRCLVGLLRPDAGRVLIGGQNPAVHPEACRRKLGVLFSEPGLCERLTACAVLTGALLLCSVCARSTREATAYLSVLGLLAMAPTFVLQWTDGVVVPVIWHWIPVFGQVLVLRQAFLGAVAPSGVAATLVSTALLVCATLILGAMNWRREGGIARL